MKKTIILLLSLYTTILNAMQRPIMPPRPSQTTVITPAMQTVLHLQLPAILDRMFHPRHYRMCGVHPISAPPRTIEYPDIPDHMIKTEERSCSRLQGARRLEDPIYTYNLHLLEIPAQEAYHIPAIVKSALSYPVPNQLIIARKIAGEHGKAITIEQAKQLKKLIETSYYCDWAETNIVHTKRNTVGLIDTELRGFTNSKDGIAEAIHSLLNRGILLEPDARAYLERELLQSKINNTFKPNA